MQFNEKNSSSIKESAPNFGDITLDQNNIIQKETSEKCPIDTEFLNPKNSDNSSLDKNDINIYDVNFFLPKELKEHIENIDEPTIKENENQKIFLEETQKPTKPEINDMYFSYNNTCQENIVNQPIYLTGNNYIFPIYNFNQNNNIINTKKKYAKTNDSNKYIKKVIDNYTIEMFGKRGWICEFCNNFNYETRKKCNRCHANKKAKEIQKYLKSEKNKYLEHKNDWYCNNCGNYNYSFRYICNRCQIKRE